MTDIVERLEGQAAHTSVALYAEAAAEIRRLREQCEGLAECLDFWAKRPTIEETLQDISPPDWARLDPEKRIEMIAARKQEHDAQVLASRSTLAAYRASEKG